jgi:hypothetical protein
LRDRVRKHDAVGELVEFFVVVGDEESGNVVLVDDAAHECTQFAADGRR